MPSKRAASPSKTCLKRRCSTSFQAESTVTQLCQNLAELLKSPHCVRPGCPFSNLRPAAAGQRTKIEFSHVCRSFVNNALITPSLRRLLTEFPRVY